MESLTDEQRANRIAALTQELQGYETYGNKERAKEVKAELDRLGAEGKAPAQRAKKAKPKAHTEL